MTAPDPTETTETTEMTGTAGRTSGTGPERPAPTTPGPAHDVLAAITALDARLGQDLGEVFACIDWAEEEIAAARARHPRHTGTLHHSFLLLSPTHDRMATEFVFRSHCRELLERVIAGTDTRPGTAAEVCCAMCDASRAVPLTSSAFGLYARMWELAGFPEFPEMAELRVHHEALERTAIDDHEQDLRRRLAVPDRRVDADIVCDGHHHGVEVRCAYAPAEQLPADD